MHEMNIPRVNQVYCVYTARSINFKYVIETMLLVWSNK